jgi:SAM-dependent methyltransferase
MMFSIFRRSIKIIETKYDSGYGTLLDVGCGYGFFLELAIKKGWDVYGVEPCKHARQLAAAKGINNISEDLFSGKYEDEMFDVITMFYVLEHLPDPMRYLKEINRILKPGGILLLRLPHTTPLVNLLKVFRIPNRLYDAPSHLSDFSPSTIALALQKAGFGQIHTCPGGFTRPSFIGPRIISSSFGLLADFLYNLSGKRFLLPGVSKTTIARKNVIHQ